MANAFREKMMSEAAGPVAIARHVSVATARESARRVSVGYAQVCHMPPALRAAGWKFGTTATYRGKEWQHPVSGKIYSLTSAYRVHLQETGCAEVANDRE